MPQLRSLSLLIPITLLAACGSSGTSSDPEPRTLDELRFAFNELNSEIITQRIPDILPADLPQTGLANYTGSFWLRDASFAEFNPATDDIYQIGGDIDIAVSFDDDSVSGTAENISDSVVGLLSGSLSIENGILDRTATREPNNSRARPMLGELTGELTAPDGGVVSLSVNVRGTFFGSSDFSGSGDILIGPLRGTATTEERDIDLTGAFGASN